MLCVCAVRVVDVRMVFVIARPLCDVPSALCQEFVPSVAGWTGATFRQQSEDACRLMQVSCAQFRLRKVLCGIARVFNNGVEQVVSGVHHLVRSVFVSACNQGCHTGEGNM
jgi:hypothetical protein